MRIALIVGIDYYEFGSQLFGCVNDANSVNNTLKRHDGGIVNFSTKFI